MTEAVKICPITKKDLELSCPTCKFVIIENNEITGCAIRRRVLSMFKTIEVSKQQLAMIKQFKDETLNGNR